MVSIQLFSYANIGGGTVAQMGSEIIEAHNLFDETSGDGEKGSEYIITKPRHLRNVSKYLDKNYKQTVDIDLTGIDTNNIAAEYKNGILTLDLPKMQEVKPETKRLEIK